MLNGHLLLPNVEYVLLQSSLAANASHSVVSSLSPLVVQMPLRLLSFSSSDTPLQLVVLMQMELAGGLATAPLF